MALLQDLIKQIDDPTLQQRITAEVNKLSKQKKFGLVFEEHLPECTPLYDVKIRRDSKVALKAGQVSDIYIVRAIDGDKALCEHKTDHVEARFALDELVAIAEFGEPIYPYLKPIDVVCNAPDSDLWHTLIEADNYHALQLLEYLYAGKVDFIYIDPPYNTGAKDWKYNNDYVDGSDSYRHSKWLSFMEKRLKIAKKLLNPSNSVLVVTIDEKEYLHLGCLLEEMFPEANMDMVTDVINAKGKQRIGKLTKVEEYIFILQFGKAAVLKENDDSVQIGDELDWRTMRRGNMTARRHYHGAHSCGPRQFFPVYVSDDGVVTGIGDPVGEDVDINSFPAPEGSMAVFPIRDDGIEVNWGISDITAKELLKNGYIRVGKYCPDKPQKWILSRLTEGRVNDIKSGRAEVIGHRPDGSVIAVYKDNKKRYPVSVWNKESHNAETQGSSLLSKIFLNGRFPYPKSLYAVCDCLRMFIANNPQALIVDFFAGSGTTLHAVNLLNAEDGGHRRCIMVTNNEVSDAEAKALTKQGLKPGDEEWEKLGIARYVTWPRTVCSIEGHDVKGNPLKGNYLVNDMPMANGFKTNAAFFKLGFLDKASVRIGRQFREMLPALWMKAGCHGACPELSGQRIPEYMVLPDNHMAILNDNTCYAAFAKEVESSPEIETIYLVTDSDADYRNMSRELNVKETYQLYRDYLDNFRINSRR